MASVIPLHPFPGRAAPQAAQERSWPFAARLARMLGASGPGGDELSALDDRILRDVGIEPRAVSRSDDRPAATGLWRFGPGL